MITMALVFGAYCLSTFPRYTLSDPAQSWAKPMLIFIGISAAAAILIQILFHILLSIGVSVKAAIRDQDVDGEAINQALQHEFTEDEREKLIALKSQQAGFYVSGIGFVGGLIILFFSGSVPLMLNILYGAFFLGTIAEGITTFVINRREMGHA
jgi:hypothetical protein